MTPWTAHVQQIRIILRSFFSSTFASTSLLLFVENAADDVPMRAEGFALLPMKLIDIVKDFIKAYSHMETKYNN